MDGVVWTKAASLTGTMLMTWDSELLEPAAGTTLADWPSG
jgi:hypothetical protein